MNVKDIINQKIYHLSNLATSNIKHITDAYSQIMLLDMNSISYKNDVKFILDTLENTSTYWLKEDEKILVDQTKYILNRIILFSSSMEFIND